MRIPANLVLPFFLACQFLNDVAGIDFAQEVLPILQERCFACHGEDDPAADLRLAQLSPHLAKDPIAAETWHDVLNVLNLGEMPPDDEPSLSVEDRKTLISWINQEIESLRRQKQRSLADLRIRRLNRTEYNHTLSDLLGISADYAAELPPDEISSDGFRNSAGSLQTSALHLQTYLKVARSALALAIVEGAEPEVVDVVSQQSVADKGKGNWTERLGRSGVFVLRSLEFPDQGEFLVRVKARAELVPGQPLPQMELTLGYRADTQTPSKQLSVVDVESEESTVYEFRGRMEQFPRQSRSQSKYKGMMLWIRNSLDDGLPPGKPKTVTTQDANGKKKKKQVWAEDPAFPKIVIEEVQFRAPVFEQWPPAHHRRILPQAPQHPDEELGVVKKVIRRFMQQAFRRPPTTSQQQQVLAYFLAVRNDMPSFESALREALSMVLISPEFLYVNYQEESEGKQLDDFAIASRLSYFLWGSMPDDLLFEAAEQDRLGNPEERRAQVRRMIRERDKATFSKQFSDQWLGLDGVNRVAVNPEYYPDFDPKLKGEMRLETQRFFEELVTQDRSALECLDAPFTMLNYPLAKHYGIQGPRGLKFEAVDVSADERRGGLLTHASVLLIGSDGEASHPILRGVWLRDRLLADPPAPPPPNVPNLDVDNKDFAKLPLKMQLKQHQENDACARCHEKIDPWGLAMESYDAVGLTRDSIAHKVGKRMTHIPVDDEVQLPGGQTVTGMTDLKSYLLTHRSEQFTRGLVQRVLSFALARELTIEDQPEVEQLYLDFADNEYRLGTLLELIAMSEIFTTR